MSEQGFLKITAAHELMRRSLGIGANIPLQFIQHDERTFTVERADGKDILPREGSKIRFTLPIPVETENFRGTGHG